MILTIQVNSPGIFEAAYDDNRCVLSLHFKNTDIDYIYDFAGVPPEIGYSFPKGQDADTYFLKYIRNQYAISKRKYDWPATSRST